MDVFGTARESKRQKSMVNEGRALRDALQFAEE
jgi:hypothetical protein